MPSFPSRCRGDGVQGRRLRRLPEKFVDTFYQRWDDVKHNIILNWIDVADDETGLGMAIFSDLVTTYVHGPEHPPALVPGMGWDARALLRRLPIGRRTRGGLFNPAASRPMGQGGHWRACRERSSRCRRAHGREARPRPRPRPGQRLRHRSRSADPHGESGCDLLVVYSERRGSVARTVSLGDNQDRVELVELDGRPIEQLPLTPTGNGRCEVTLAIPRFDIRTLRCYGVGNTVS